MSQEPELQPRVAPTSDDVPGTSAGPSGASEVPAKRSERKARAVASQRAEAAPEMEERPAAQVYHVTLPAFEGPLDLLLHLIQQHELDIFDIPIGFIGEKYVEYILLMQELNIDLASEYLVMAATLAHIKSKLLLPTPPADQEEDADVEADPRAELVRRLLEYQKYRKAAEELGEHPVLGRDVFPRGAPAPTVEGPAPLAPVSVFKLLDAFQGILKRVKQTAEHLIGVDRISISERIVQLTDLLRGRSKVRFEDLFDENVTRADLIVTFLALLEMTRLRMTKVIQDGPLEPIVVELAVDESAESRVLDGYTPPSDEEVVAPAPADYEEEVTSDEETLGADSFGSGLLSSEELEDELEDEDRLEDSGDEAWGLEDAGEPEHEEPPLDELENEELDARAPDVSALEDSVGEISVNEDESSSSDVADVADSPASVANGAENDGEDTGAGHD